MKSLVFDVNVILDLWLERRSESHLLQLADLLESATSNEYMCWVCSSSLHVLEYVTHRELKKNGADPLEAKRTAKRLLEQLLQYVSVLSCFGFQQDEVLTSQTDLEDAQIVRAASQINGPTAIVTNEKRFDTSGTDIQELMPSKVRDWLREPVASIDLVDLKSQQDVIRPNLEKNIHTVLHHGKYILGPEVFELEERLSEYSRAEHVVSCSSGTDALLMALMALDVGPGDAVFTTSFSFIATADVIARLGATPIFVDIDPRTYNLDPDQLDQAIRAVQANESSLYPIPQGPEMNQITNNTSREPNNKSLITNNSLTPKAVIPVDLYGLPCDYQAINAVASKHGLKIVQDGAQSFGAEYRGTLCPTLGDIGCASFFPSKPLGSYGDAGALFTQDRDLAERLRSIRVHGQGASKYDTVRLGLKGRMDTMQAAILLPKLDIYAQELELRRKIAERYKDLLRPLSSVITPPAMPEGHKSAWAVYTVLTRDSEQRSALQAGLKEQGIPSVIYYGRPLHLQPLFQPLGYQKGDCPVAEDSANRVLSLPMHPYLEQEDMERVVSVVRDNI